jgi:hypothetical protein
VREVRSEWFADDFNEAPSPPKAPTAPPKKLPVVPAEWFADDFPSSK